MDMTASDSLQIQSWNGPYTVRFRQTVAEAAGDIPRDRPLHIVMDTRVALLHATALAPLLTDARSVHPIEALEGNKSLEVVPALVQRLSEAGIRRDHLLLAIGGGILQDMTCFVASILFRGMDWAFLPSTLLAQADSCIGSKSSINAAGVKNLVGNFYPPRQISIATQFIATLDPRDVRSGVGEMLKVHAIDGPASYDRIAEAYSRLFTETAVMLEFIRASLLIKKQMIEVDEFDRGPRNVFNYGHSFGHAIEAATGYAVPHGIAVTMGMDMANHVSTRMGRMPAQDFARMHPVLRRNYDGYEAVPVPVDRMLEALSRDKKNVGTDLSLILPNTQSRIEKVRVPPDTAFRDRCREFLDDVRRRA
jgi:3-dehydroquinate synthase